MLASLLNSDRAIMANSAITRLFVHLRNMSAPHKDLSRNLVQMEEKYDAQFKVGFDAFRNLMEPPGPPKRRFIGFRTPDE